MKIIGKAGDNYMIHYPVGCHGEYVNFWIKGEFDLPDKFNLGGSWWTPISFYHFDKKTFGSACLT